MAKKFYLMPALDTTDMVKLSGVIQKIGNHPMLSGFKVGFSLGLTHGLPRVVEMLRRYSDKPIVYDHQKAATDIPDTGKLFAATMKNAGVNQAILFPQAGPATLQAWVEALREAGIEPIVGGLMTHPKYVVSEGGFLTDEGVVEMYRFGRKVGVKGFVVPLTKPDAVNRIVDAADLTGDLEFYSPGFGAQGGDPAAFGKLPVHHLIVGRALLGAEDPVAYLDKTQKELEALS